MPSSTTSFQMRIITARSASLYCLIIIAGKIENLRFRRKDLFYEAGSLNLQEKSVPAHICAVGLYCKASRAHLRHARAALATKPRYASLVPRGSLSLTRMPGYFLNKSECEPVSTNSRTRIYSSIL